MKQIARHTSEADLAKSIVEYLESLGWETYKEVRGGGVGSRIADIVAVKDGLIWVIEAKLAFTAVVVEQAWRWNRDAHFISIAVPHKNLNMKGSSVLRAFCRQEGIGIFGVRPSSSIRPAQMDQLTEPSFRHITTENSKILKHLLPQQKLSNAGTKGEIITPYRITVDAIGDFLRENGPSTVRNILVCVPHHYKTKASARQSLIKNLLKFESDRFEKVLVDGEVGFKLKDPAP